MEYHGFNAYPSPVRCGICDKSYVNVNNVNPKLKEDETISTLPHGQSTFTNTTTTTHINSHGENTSSRSSQVSNMLCASCISFKMLKFRLNIINLEDFNTKASFEVNQILEGCMNGNASVLLQNYIVNKGQESGMGQSTSNRDIGGQTRNEEGGDDQRDEESRDVKLVDGIPIPSQDSVSRLAHLLLNIEISNLHDRLKSVKSKIAHEQEKKEELRLKILRLNDQIDRRRSDIDDAYKLLKANRDAALTKIETSITEIQVGKLQNIEKLIHNSRLKLTKQSIDILAVKRLTFDDEQQKLELDRSQSIPNFRILNSKASDEFLNKLNKNLVKNYIKNKSYTISDFKISIGFIPLLPITKYINYTAQLINGSLAGLSELISSMAFSLGIELFFPIYKFTTDSDTELLNSRNSGGKTNLKKHFEPYMTSIGGSKNLYNLDASVFPLYIARMGKSKDELGLVELETAQLFVFSQSLARLIIDLLLVIKNIDKQGELFPLDSVKLEQLLNLDQLVKTVVFDILLNDKTASSNNSAPSSEMASDRNINITKTSSSNQSEGESNRNPTRRVSFSEAVFNFWTRKKKDSSSATVDSEGALDKDKESDTSKEKPDEENHISKVEKLSQFNFEYYQNIYRSEKIDLASKLSMSSLNTTSSLLASLTIDGTNQSRSISPDIVNISNSNSSSQSTLKMKNKLTLSSMDAPPVSTTTALEDPSTYVFDSASIWNVDLMARKLFEFFCYDISKAAENLDIFKMYNNVTMSDDSTIISQAGSQATWNSQTFPNVDKKSVGDDIKYRSNNGSTGFSISPKTKNSMALSSASMTSFPYTSNIASTSVHTSDNTPTSHPRHQQHHHHHHHHQQRDRSSHHHLIHHHGGSSSSASSSSSSLSAMPRNAAATITTTLHSSSSSSPSPLHGDRSYQRTGRLVSPGKPKRPKDDNWEVI